MHCVLLFKILTIAISENQIPEPQHTCKIFALFFDPWSIYRSIRELFDAIGNFAGYKTYKLVVIPGELLQNHAV